MAKANLFNEAVAAALDAAKNYRSDLVRRIWDIDVFFVATSEEDRLKRIREVVLPALQESPELMQRFNFASSLVGEGSSPFFRTVMEICAERSDALKAQDLLPIIESFRRGQKYVEMDFYVDLLKRKLAGDMSATAWKMKAKATYELHMAAYQRAEMEVDSAVKQDFYKKSLALAEQSSNEAEKAGDQTGKLFALMNISGLLTDQIGLAKALELSEQVGDEAEALAANATDEDERNRALRIAMNTYFHRFNLAVSHDLGVGLVDTMLREIEANPVYQSSKDQDWMKKHMEAAQAYLRR